MVDAIEPARASRKSQRTGSSDGRNEAWLP